MSNLLPQGRRTVTLERLVYGFALKAAVRRGGASGKIESGRQYVLVLRLPADADLYEYLAAASILVRRVDALNDFAVTSPKVTAKGAIDHELINGHLKLGRSLLVIWPSSHEMPRAMSLVADRVVDVGPVRPMHLVAAAKEFAGQTIEPAAAKKLLDYPLSEVFGAFRTKRPLAEVLERLAAVKVVAPPVLDGPCLEDLVGYGPAKEWGLALAQDIRAWQDGKLSWSDVDRGLLLSGPPGTGKTLFAGALARSCGAHLVATSVARWQAAGHLDAVLKAMHRSFDEAVANKPSIIFLDEFDGIGDRTRLVGNQHETYWAQVINLLLELIDGHARLEGVVVIGATNYPDVIDGALLRPGRLDRHIKISLPDVEERKHLSRFYFGDDAPDEVVEALAAATAGLTGAHFAKAGREAKRAARRAGRAVDIEDVLAVLPAPRKIMGAERRMIAIHEAGHAVVGVRLGIGNLQTVAVPLEVHASRHLGFAHFQIDDNPMWDRQEYLDQIAMLLAGRAAEEIIIGTAFEGAGAGKGADLHKASDLATILELQFCMGEGLAYFNLNSVEQRDEVRQNNPVVAARVERLLQREMERSRDIVTRFRVVIEKIADVLVAKAVIDGGEVVRIIREASK